MSTFKLKDWDGEIDTEGCDIEEVINLIDSVRLEVKKLLKQSDNDTKIGILRNYVAEQFCDAEIRSYSGRCMYGKECVAISCERKDSDKIVGLAESYGFTGARKDEMGLGAIIYWPSIEYGEEDGD